MFNFFLLKQNAKVETEAVMRQLNGAESEVKALRSMTQRMILTQKEMVHISTVVGVHWYLLIT